MRTAARGHENPALDVALGAAAELDVPVLVYHAVSEAHPYASDRIHTFILEGARDVSAELAERNIGYVCHVERPGQRGAHLADLGSARCARRDRGHARRAARRVDADARGRHSTPPCGASTPPVSYRCGWSVSPTDAPTNSETPPSRSAPSASGATGPSNPTRTSRSSPTTCHSNRWTSRPRISPSWSPTATSTTR